MLVYMKSTQIVTDFDNHGIKVQINTRLALTDMSRGSYLVYELINNALRDRHDVQNPYKTVVWSRFQTSIGALGR